MDIVTYAAAVGAAKKYTDEHGGGGSDSTPVGVILPFGGTTAPSGYLMCTGQAVSRTTYAALFAVIGTSFGSGDGSTTFNVPDLRGEFLRGAGTNSHSGQGDGGAVGEHQDATNHLNIGINQEYNDITVIGDAYSGILKATNYDKKGANGTSSHWTSRGGSAQDTSNSTYYTSRPTNTSVNYIIKAS